MTELSLTQLVFRLGGYTLALPAEKVLSIADWEAPRRLPRRAPHVSGYLRIGSSAVPVLELPALLGIRAGEPRYRIHAGTAEEGLLLPATEILAVRQVPLEDFGRSALLPEFAATPYIHAMGIAGSQAFAVLNTDALLATLHPQEDLVP